MKVKQFRYGADNFGYLVCGRQSALAIDGGAVDAIMAFLRDHDLQLKYVANTHSHPDHTQGTPKLLSATGAEYLDFQRLTTDKAIKLENYHIKVHHTPGHTMDSVTFEADAYLLTGDTLFNATVGNCFTGDLQSFYQSIKHLMAFPDHMTIYAGHDYVKESLAFARHVEPGNPAIDEFLQAYKPEHVYSTMAQERLINPYLRFNEPDVISFMQAKGLTVGTEYDRWEAIMSIE